MGKTKLKIKQFPSDIKVTKGNKSKKSGQEEMRHQNNLPAMQVLSTSWANKCCIGIPIKFLSKFRPCIASSNCFAEAWNKMPPCAFYKQPYSRSPHHFKELQLNDLHTGFWGFFVITELLQTGWVWKITLKVIWSNPPAQVGPPAAGCPGPCPDGFWLSPRREASQPLWATCVSAQPQ